MKRANFISYLLAAFLGGVAGLLTLFGIFEHFSMPDRNHNWRSYHEMILENVSGPRVLIESGSNSLHSIRPDIIERALNIPVFVIADNAAVPFDLKIKRLDKYAKVGDIIVLPLEWGYYGWHSVPSDFLNSLIERWPEYYVAMSLAERFEFFVRYVLLDLLSSHVWINLRKGTKAKRAASYAHLLEEMAHWSGVFDTSIENREPHISIIGKTCREFLAVPSKVNAITEDIIKALAALQRRRGVKVVMAWPAVAGSDCYSDPGFPKYVEELRRDFAEQGISFAGNPEDSAFSKEHLLDTYYHVDIIAAARRTQSLADALKELGLARNHPDTPSDTLADRALIAEATRVFAKNKISRSPLSSGNYRVGTDGFERSFLLLGGWEAIESWGVWNSGPISKLLIWPNPERGCQIFLDANYFADAPASEAQVNGRSAGTDSLGQIWIDRGEQPVTLTLLHHKLRSPQELSIGNDRRKLAFGLKNVVVNCDATPRTQPE